MTFYVDSSGQCFPGHFPNRATPEGRELGGHMARLCDVELRGRPDRRCATCAFRAGDHLANGSPETLMDALKCALEGAPFYCHEADRPCAGWLAMYSRPAERVRAPWELVGGID
jgi:hypothetical protein